ASKISARVEFARSPSSTSSSGYLPPSSARVWPQTSRWASSFGFASIVTSAPRAGRDVGDGARVLLVGHHLRVPVVVVLHVGDALALDRARDHGRRLPLVRLGGAQRPDHVLDVVAVALDHVPAEGGELLARIRARGLDGARLTLVIHQPAELLQRVEVEDRGQVVELVAFGDERRLPDLPLLDLPVAEDAEGVEVHLLQLGSERESNADRQPLPERAGRGVEAGQLG